MWEKKFNAENSVFAQRPKNLQLFLHAQGLSTNTLFFFKCVNVPKEPNLTKTYHQIAKIVKKLPKMHYNKAQIGKNTHYVTKIV